MTVFQSATQVVRTQVRQWVDRRQPLSSAESLTQKNIYILPSRQSYGFMFVVLLLWLVGTNYENNLVLALSYLLMSVFVSGIFSTHANLSGLKISVVGCGQAFAGQPMKVYLRLSNPSNTNRIRLHFDWAEAETVSVDINSSSEIDLEMNLPTTQRGWLRPGRLRIESSYPLGLFNAWTLPKLSAPALVFPNPISAQAIEGAGSEGEEGQVHKRGIDDFGGLDAWRPGIPLQRIAWKQYSAGKGMLEKKFEAHTSNPQWIDWDNYPDLATERRLSALCDKAIEMERADQHYGLRIPGTTISPSEGDAHLVKVLTALACFELDGAQESVRRDSDY